MVFGRRSMPPKTMPARITIDSALGRSSVASGGTPFPPCLIACSPSGYQSPSHSSHTAARPRTNAVTLDPRRARVIFRLSFRSPATRAGFPSLSLRRYASAFPPCGVRAPCGHTRPATHPRHAPSVKNLPRLLMCAGIGNVRSRVNKKSPCGL